MATKDIKLEHFTGKNTIEAKHWLSLFEVVCAQLKLITSEDKTVKLMSYLKDDALAFFAQSIAPHISTITWSEVRSKFEKRFGTPDVSSIVTANHRQLQKAESIKGYFDDKMKYLDKTSLTDQEKSDLLTDGLPDSYQTYLLPVIISTPEDWLQRAIRVELTVNRKPFLHKESHLKAQPPLCRFCDEQGLVEYHWHSECRIKAKLRQSSSGQLPSVSNQLNHRNRRPSQTTESTDSQTASDTSSTSSDESEENNFCSSTATEQVNPFLSVDVTLDGQQFNAIVDSASTISVISEKTFKSLSKQLVPNSPIKINHISGQTQTLGSIRANLQIANTAHETKFHVISHFKYPLLLGLDTGKLFGLSLDLKQSKVSVQSNPPNNEYSSPRKPQQPMRPQPTQQPILTQPQLSAPLPPQTTNQKQSQQPSQQIRQHSQQHSPQSVRSHSKPNCTSNQSLLSANIDEGSGHSKSHLNPGFSMCETKVDSLRKQRTSSSKYQPNSSHKTKFKEASDCQQNHCSTSDNELNSHQRQHNRRFTRFNRHFVPQQQNFQVGRNVVNRQSADKPPPRHLGHPWPSHSLKVFFYQNY